MEKKLIILFAILFSGVSYTQVGINTQTPKTTLDVAAKGGTEDPDGLQAPRLTRADLTSKGNILYGTDQKGAFIYITDISGGDISGPRTNINTVCYYYFDGTAWQKLSAGGNGVGVNLYNSNGVMTSDRAVDQQDKVLSFTSTATTGTSHFSVDGSTFSVDAVNHRMGIGTVAPSEKLDVDGNIRARGIQQSSSTNDVALVVDNNGVLKKQLSDLRGTFRAYLNSDFNAGSNESTIYKVTNWNVIDDPGNDFNLTQNYFTAPVTGLYKVTLTYTVTTNSTLTSTNLVSGIADNVSGTWIMRFSMKKETILENNSTVGTAFTFVGVVNLTAGMNYFLGLSGKGKIIANPSGGTGTGIGSFVEIQIIK